MANNQTRIDRDRARDVIEEIQFGLFMHPDDFAKRAKQPDSLETKRQLDSIRRNERILENNSSDLYADPTHFIFELIQNADDVIYPPTVVPTLKLCLSRSLLLVEYNESGFRKENVRSICDLYDSTKKGEKSVDEGSIGEKGIGFKSVFAVADRVNIFSNGFNFGFDRNRQLGMLNPILLEPGENARDGWTILHLHLALDNNNFAHLKETLQSLSPEMLLFTRRLKGLELLVETDEFGKIEVRPIRFRVIDERATDHFVTLESPSGNRKYLLSPMDIPMMPANPKRPNQTKSRMVLAFPINPDGPLIEAQNIFAYLPLYRTAFPFLLHADFITQTSREGILEQDPWNIYLRDRVAATFIYTLEHHLLTHSRLHINAIHYIPYGETSPSDNFLKSISKQILKLLKHKKILRTLAGEWVDPENAIIFPSRYFFDGVPLFAKEDLRLVKLENFEYASPEYNTSSRLQAILGAIGCRIMNSETMFSILSSPRFTFGRKPYVWIKSLFKLLIALSSTDAPHNFQLNIKSLRCLKLSNGAWGSINTSHPIFFPVPSDGPSNLGDLDLNILDMDFHNELCSDPAVEAFLTYQLGISRISERNVIESIITYHESAKPLTVDRILNHADYIMCRQHLVTRDLKLRIKNSFRVFDQSATVIKNGKTILDRKLALGGKSHINLSTLCDGKKMSFLHELFSTDGLDGFVRQYLGVKPFPSLLNNGFYGRQPALFYTEFLAPKRTGTNVLLNFLCQIWSEVQPHEKTDFCAAETVRQLAVICETGARAALSSCFLRTSSLRRHLAKEMPVLRIDDPDNPKWKFLTQLGVSIEPNLRLFVHWLQLIKLKPLSHQLEEEVDGVYTDLVKFGLKDDTTDFESELRTSFANEKLLLISHDSGLRWLSPNEARVGCPSWVRSTLSVSESRSVYRATLYEWLQMPQWDIERDIRLELLGGISRYLYKGLKSIIPYLPANGCPTWIRNMLTAAIFPITTSSGSHQVGLLSADLFVPDSTLLNSSFQDKVNRLDFGDEDFRALLPLLRHASLKYLSSYDNHETMAIKVISPVTDDVESLEQILSRKSALTSWGITRTNNNWDMLQLKTCDALEQTIEIPEFGIKESHSRDFYVMKHGDKATIYIVRHKPLSIRLLYLGDPLARHFETPSIAASITQILRSPLHELDELLMIMNIPPLPISWEKAGDIADVDEKHTINHFDSFDGIKDVEISPSAAKQIVKRTELAIRSHENVNAQLLKGDRISPSRSPLSFSGLSSNAIRGLTGADELSLQTSHLSISNFDDQATHMLKKVFTNPEIEARHTSAYMWGSGISHRNYESGFAGEYFVYRLLQEKLPGFSEFNWTSHLRKYADLPPCNDGAADFFYEENMSKFAQLFGLEPRRVWKKALIEVKSTVGTEDYFHFSAAQFEKAQECNGSEVLYVIVRVENSLTNPTISDIIDEPIRFLSVGDLFFSSSGDFVVTVRSAE